jgi:hypothetical protein
MASVSYASNLNNKKDVSDVLIVNPFLLSLYGKANSESHYIVAAPPRVAWSVIAQGSLPASFMSACGKPCAKERI